MSSREYSSAEFTLWPDVPIDAIDDFIDSLNPETHQDVIDHLREKRREAVLAAEQKNFSLALAHGETLTVLCHYYGKTNTLARLARRAQSFTGRKPGSKASTTLYLEELCKNNPKMTAREIAEKAIALSLDDDDSPYEFDSDDSVYVKGKPGLITLESLSKRIEYVRKQMKKSAI